MKLSIFFALAVSIVTNGACAEVVDPCLVCRDGATNGDDFAPFESEGLNATCAVLIEEIKGIEAESEACTWGGEDIRSVCCPDTLPENPCMACPDGITVGEDFVPWANGGATDTCKALIDAAAISYEDGSEPCTYFREEYEIFCCPTAADNPCIICPDGATAADDFAPFAPFAKFNNNVTCKEYIEFFSKIEQGSETCEDESQQIVGYCCPTTVENPCIAPCPDGITAGDDFAPYAEGGYLKPCEEIIKEYQFYDAGNSQCAWSDWDEALCCPTTPKNPCIICPDGLTAADDFFPPGDTQTCQQNVDTFKLVEIDSYPCIEWSAYYEMLCCPNLKGTSTAATTNTGTSTTTTLTTDATTSAASTSSDATSTTATDNSELTTTTATVVPPTEPIASGGVTVFEVRGFAFIIGVSALSLIAFV